MLFLLCFVLNLVDNILKYDIKSIVEYTA